MFIYVDEKLKLPGQVSKTPVGLKCSVGEVCDTVAEFTPFGRVGEGWGEERVWMGLLVVLKVSVPIRGDTRRRRTSSVFLWRCGGAGTGGHHVWPWPCLTMLDQLASRTGFPDKKQIWISRTWWGIARGPAKSWPVSCGIGTNGPK